MITRGNRFDLSDSICEYGIAPSAYLNVTEGDLTKTERMEKSEVKVVSLGCEVTIWKSLLTTYNGSYSNR